ncbi:MAG: two-component system OmpR family response regulator [Crocinitomicaceae bacterium]|jgi:two-component system OmpR family response regulator
MEVSKPKKIFIVDDDEMLTMAMEDYLTKDTPHNISIFHTGEDAIKSIQENPDVVILDYFLNSVDKTAADGLEILKAIRKHLPDTQFIMLSSQESYSTAAKTIQQGAEHYVIKDEDSFEKIASLIRKN